MHPFKNMIRCFRCDSEFQFGPDIYAGTNVVGYGFTACRNCYSANWDGWAPEHEAKILAHLRSNGVKAPPRNVAGWLPQQWPAGLKGVEPARE